MRVFGLVLAVWCAVMVGCAFSVGHTRPRLMKTYIIVISLSDKDIQKEIAADSISEHNGCVLFWRGKTLDTVLCERLARIVVTEKNQ